MPVANFHSAQARAALSDPLQPYQPSAAMPWNEQRVAHLYRRLGFGATYEQIQQGLQMSPSDLIDQLLDTAADLGAPDPPYWGGWTLNEYENNADPDLKFTHRDELRRRWLREMLDEGVRAKMAFFWHNHFVTELQVYDCNAFLWSYFSLIHEYAFGNFRVFTREMGKTGAMLSYLNGNQNVAGEPNENYARELMELFTMGESNGYTQADIVEMARALTGWRASDYYCQPPYFDPDRHDSTPKTIFGQTANYNYTTAHNLVFSERAEQVSHFISGKLYRHFLYPTIHVEAVNTMAQTFANSNWELLPVIKQLVKSEHFFEERFMAAQIKSPVEAMLQIWKSAGVNGADTTDNWLDNFSYWSYQLGQELFNPPNVAGWKGHHNWLNESTLTGRWEYCNRIAGYIGNDDVLKERLRTLALQLSAESADPAIITSALISHFSGQGLDPVFFQAAVLNFKSGIPDNYYDDGSWNLYWDEAPDQIINLLNYLVRLPEFQLT